jgi:anti-sigma-K factor RskA
MTMSDGAPKAPQNVEPAEIETLLPWYVAGRLRRRDRQRVDDALRNDPELARKTELAREELAETIRLNETLGAPSARVMDRLMSAIDAEDLAARKRRSPRAAATWFAHLIASFSPRTLALAASIAAIAIAVQAFALVDMLAKPQNGSQTAQQGHGTFAMVHFTRQANAAEITNFLEDYQATVVDGPEPGGAYRVRITVRSLAKEELGHIMSRIRQERVIESAEATE